MTDNNVNEARTTKPIRQSSIRAPFMTYIVLFVVFFFIHSFLFPSNTYAFPTYITYSLFAPLLILFYNQQKMPFYLYPTTGFLMSAFIQTILYPNIRYVISNGIMGATLWALVFLLSNWIIRNLSPPSPPSFFKDNKTTLVTPN